MLNVAVLMGRLVADPELRHTPSNVPVTTITLAVERSYKQGDERQTDFIDVVAWRHTAEFVCRYFKKGQLVAVEGQIQTRSYTDSQGVKRKAFEIVANSVHFAESKRDSAGGGNTETRFTPPPTTFENGSLESGGMGGNLGDFEELEEDDELPF